MTRNRLASRPAPSRERAIGQDSIQRQYRVRIGLFLASVLAALLALGTLVPTVNTLRRLEVVEAERDTWQRPQDVVRALDLRGGEAVADIGCGAGYFALKLSRAVGESGQVIAVDIRRVPLLFLRLRAVLDGRDNLRVAHGDTDDPHLAPGTVDAVLIANTFHELTRPESILDRVGRALRRRGRLVILDPGPDAAHATGERHLTPRAVEEQLRRAGFEILDRHDVFIALPDGSSWWLIVARKPQSDGS